MLIIVEGMDNTGKTTLINRLADDLKLLVMGNRRRPSRSEDILHYTFHLTELSQCYDVIIDRWSAISEPIYGPICRGTSWPDMATQTALMEHISMLRPLLIYCRPEDQVVLDFGDRSQMEGVIQNAEALLKEYDQKMEWVNGWISVMNYDYATHEYVDILSQVKEHLHGTCH